MKHTIITLLLFIANSARAADISDLSFLTGCWTMQDGDTTLSEVWTKSSKNLMQAIVQTKNAQDEVTEYEFLRIEKKTGGIITFTPYINGRQMQDFLFDENSSRNPLSFRAVFVNEQNDFPKKIRYDRAKADDGRLSIHLEGTGQDGEFQEIDFSMLKSDCNQIF